VRWPFCFLSPDDEVIGTKSINPVYMYFLFRVFANRKKVSVKRWRCFMPRGVILVDYTDQGRRTIKDSPDRAEASKVEAAKLGIQVKDLFYTPGGPHDAAIIIEAEGPEPINKFMSSIQSLGNVKMKFIRAFSIEEMRKMV
jgi:uncharacterized protein with GYD domain